VVKRGLRLPCVIAEGGGTGHKKVGRRHGGAAFSPKAAARSRCKVRDAI
jgi:hypothetical protein